jgi:hypothetical protein
MSRAKRTESEIIAVLKQVEAGGRRRMWRGKRGRPSTRSTLALGITLKAPPLKNVKDGAPQVQLQNPGHPAHSLTAKPSSTRHNRLLSGISIPCMEGAVDYRIGIVLGAGDNIFNPFLENCLFSPDRNRLRVLNFHYEQSQFFKNQFRISLELLGVFGPSNNVYESTFGIP